MNTFEKLHVYAMSLEEVMPCRVWPTGSAERGFGLEESRGQTRKESAIPQTRADTNMGPARP